MRAGDEKKKDKLKIITLHCFRSMAIHTQNSILPPKIVSHHMGAKIKNKIELQYHVPSVQPVGRPQLDFFGARQPQHRDTKSAHVSG